MSAAGCYGWAELVLAAAAVQTGWLASVVVYTTSLATLRAQHSGEKVISKVIFYVFCCCALGLNYKIFESEVSLSPCQVQPWPELTGT